MQIGGCMIVQKIRLELRVLSAVKHGGLIILLVITQLQHQISTHFDKLVKSADNIKTTTAKKRRSERTSDLPKIFNLYPMNN